MHRAFNCWLAALPPRYVDGVELLNVGHQRVTSGIRPNSVTVLSTCSLHAILLFLLLLLSLTQVVISLSEIIEGLKTRKQLTIVKRPFRCRQECQYNECRSQYTIPGLRCMQSLKKGSKRSVLKLPMTACKIAGNGAIFYCMYIYIYILYM